MIGTQKEKAQMGLSGAEGRRSGGGAKKTGNWGKSRKALPGATIHEKKGGGRGEGSDNIDGTGHSRREPPMNPGGFRNAAMTRRRSTTKNRA